MEVITSHTNADFDTLASMIAALKLYPGAHLVFSGSLEKGLKDAVEARRFPYRFERVRDIDLEEVTRLILVDVRHPARIGRFAEIVGRPGLDIHIYDHHPATDGDLHGTLEVIEPYGSTTTVLTLLIRRKKLKISPEDATILMAGIYEDTGSLSYPSTTRMDYEAASYLLSAGADLRVVTDLLRKELTAEEVSILNDFLNSRTSYTIGGVEVVIAEGYLEKYSGDIATIAHRIMDIGAMGCLFLLAETRDRVHIIARSRNPRADAGRIARALGGGGHAEAASATLKDVTLIEAKERLLSALRENIVPEKTAGDIMSFPPIIVRPDMPLKNAIELMLRYNINAVPVVRNGRLAGVITRQVVDKAAYHGLGAAPVGDYMTTEFDSVTVTTSVDEIRDKVVGHGQRLLPVLDEREVVGVITRTDLLKLFQEELKEGGQPRARSLARMMKERLPAWALEMLKGAGLTAESLGLRAYVVGGFVRDLLLNRENLDIDIVIEGGDGISFAEAFAKERGLKVRPHQRFKTAVVIFPDGFKVDVATARLEYYEKPGALPTIEQSSLKLDLYRRDFTINTLAVALNPRRFGELIDFFGAQKDIKDKTIRVLHNLSFVEDPTRMLRAVRFSEKFAFKLGKHTLNLIKNSVKLDMLSRLSGARLLDEIKHILEEDAIAVKSLWRLHELGILKLIHKGITWDEQREEFLERAREAITWHELLYTRDRAEAWLVMYLALTDGLSDSEYFSLIKRLMINGRKNMTVLESRRSGIEALKKVKSMRKNSDLYGLLSEVPLEVELYLLAKSDDEAVRKTLSFFLRELKYAKTDLKGKDLLKMGIKAGPAMGEILKLLLKKKLDNELPERNDEEAFVKGYLKAAR